MSPLRGEKPICGLLSKRNPGMAARPAGKNSKCPVAAPRKRRSYLSRRKIYSFTVGGNSIDFVESFVQLNISLVRSWTNVNTVKIDDVILWDKLTV